MKAYLAQINTTPNDFLGNVEKIVSHIKIAHEKDSRETTLVVFPELTIPGYLIEDMVYGEDFVEKNIAALTEICEHTQNMKNIYAFVGYVSRNNSGSGKPFYNSVAVIHRGLVVAKYNKWLFPFYDVFSEPRWFEPGTDTCVLKIDNKKIGIVVCEDSWNDRGQDDYNHHNNPLSKYREIGVDWIVSLNSSPYVKDKPFLRHVMISKVCFGSFGMIYVNQIGGQDSLVFDGHSFAMNKNGQVMGYIKNNEIEPAVLTMGSALTVNLDEPSHIYYQADDNELMKMVLLGMYDYAKKSGFNKFVTGSSGGIDSAVILALATIAFGPDAVHGIRMPSKWSSSGSTDDALELHKNLGIHDYLVPIDHDPVISYYNEKLGLDNTKDNYNKVADENIQARIRGQIVMHFSNANNALSLTTTNKTENALGYGTLFGDLAGTLNPIGDIYKLEVYQIAREINDYFKKPAIPQNIIAKAPSAELAPGQTDEAALMPYVLLDRVVEAYVEDYVGTLPRFFQWLVTNKQIVIDKDTEFYNILVERYAKMIKRIDNMEFKRRQTAPCFKMTRKAFGVGRRLPIVKK